MRLENVRAAIGYAWHGSGRRWHTAPIGIVGGAIGGIIFWLLGLRMPDALRIISDNPFWGPALGVVLCAVAGVAIVFITRLCWWPFHKQLEPYGGLTVVLRALFKSNLEKWLVEGWHLIVVGSAGAIIFLIVALVGVIWHVVHPPKEAFRASSSSEPLPQGAKFRIGDRIFFYVPHEYSKREASEILDVLEDMENDLRSKVTPIIAQIQNLFTPFPQNIKGNGGPKAVGNLLNDADRSQLIPAIKELQKIIEKYPTHSRDIYETAYGQINFGDMRGAMEKFETQLLILPADADLKLIEGAAGGAHQNFLSALQVFSNQTNNFYFMIMNAKPELRYLINRP